MALEVMCDFRTVPPSATTRPPRTVGTSDMPPPPNFAVAVCKWQTGALEGDVCDDIPRQRGVFRGENEREEQREIERERL